MSQGGDQPRTEVFAPRIGALHHYLLEIASTFVRMILRAGWPQSIEMRCPENHYPDNKHVFSWLPEEHSQNLCKDLKASLNNKCFDGYLHFRTNIADFLKGICSAQVRQFWAYICAKSNMKNGNNVLWRKNMFLNFTDLCLFFAPCLWLL